MNKRTIIMLLASAIVVGLVIAVIIKLLPQGEKVVDTRLKNYKVNEYIPTYVSDEDMAKIYLNDYVHNMFYDIEAAYNSLDEQYRSKKFGSLNNYKTYVMNLKNDAFVLSRYSKRLDGDYEIFSVYDTYGNLYIFKTTGVLQYVVYLDNYTVEI